MSTFVLQSKNASYIIQTNMLHVWSGTQNIRTLHRQVFPEILKMRNTSNFPECWRKHKKSLRSILYGHTATVANVFWKVQK